MGVLAGVGGAKRGGAAVLEGDSSEEQSTAQLAEADCCHLGTLRDLLTREGGLKHRRVLPNLQ